MKSVHIGDGFELTHPAWIEGATPDMIQSHVRAKLPWLADKVWPQGLADVAKEIIEVTARLRRLRPGQRDTAPVEEAAVTDILWRHFG